jgi:hypothetical protein
MKPVAKRNVKLNKRYSHKHCPTVISLSRQSTMFQHEIILETIMSSREGKRREQTISKGRLVREASNKGEASAGSTL